MNLQLEKIKFAVFDFDGVFTNNQVIINEKGEEAVVCNRSDGIGLSRLKGLGVDVMILSGEINAIVQKRAAKLEINCVNACDDKLNKLKEEAQKRGISLDEVAYVGNDTNDIDCLKAVGMPIVVSDAHKDVIPFGKYITKLGGGKGAVREICDLISSAKKRSHSRNVYKKVCI